jgi:hypothetical protein
MSARAGGPKTHFHKTISESFFVLNGAVRLFNGEQWIDAQQGDFLHVPQGGPHAFRNDSDAPADMLLLFTPGARPVLRQARLVLRGVTGNSRVKTVIRGDRSTSLRCAQALLHSHHQQASPCAPRVAQGDIEEELSCTGAENSRLPGSERLFSALFTDALPGPFDDRHQDGGAPCVTHRHGRGRKAPMAAGARGPADIAKVPESVCSAGELQTLRQCGAAFPADGYAIARRLPARPIAGGRAHYRCQSQQSEPHRCGGSQETACAKLPAGRRRPVPAGVGAVVHTCPWDVRSLGGNSARAFQAAHSATSW